MMKTIVLILLIGFAVADNILRVKLNKNKGSRPFGIRHRFGQTNETLKDHEDMYYTGEVHIGTPSKKFIVDFDTGSGITWIASDKCSINGVVGCPAQVNKYNVNESSTSKDINETFIIQYGKGSVSGRLVSDIVGLTPDANETSTEKDFVFGAADILSSDFSTNDMDGLFGLSFRSPRFEHPVFIEYLRDHNTFEKPVFTVWLDVNVDQKVLGGEIIFGGKDENRCGKEVVTVPAGIDKPWWTFRLGGSFLNGEHISGEDRAVTDTGTTLIYAPNDAYTAISKKYPLETQLFDCSENRDIKLELEIGGQKLALTHKDLFIEIDGKCVIGILNAGGSNFNGWLLGDTFIKGYCQIHNYKDETLTLATAIHPGKDNNTSIRPNRSSRM